MKKHISISITSPCSENWNNFKTTPQGGFCGSCQKNVIDFTHLSDDEIINILSKKTEATCGRFRTSQLKRYTIEPALKMPSRLKLLHAGLLGLICMLSSYPGISNSIFPKPACEIFHEAPLHQKLTFSRSFNDPVKGIVKSEENKPMPGVNIHLKNSDSGTVSDANGQFQFPVELKAGDVLVFSYIGYRTFEYVVTENAPDELEISMSSEEFMMMGTVAVDEVYEP